MDTSKPFLSGLAATIVGTIGLLLVAMSPSLPATWAFVAGLVGFIACVLAGFSARPPAFVEGSPKLQGAALSIAIAVGGFLVQFWPMIPAGWPQSLAAGLAALLGWLTGKAIPQAGSTAQPALPSAQYVPFVAPPAVTGAATAADAINRTWPPRAS